jgi:hypothetical protein
VLFQGLGKATQQVELNEGQNLLDPVVQQSVRSNTANNGKRSSVTSRVGKRRSLRVHRGFSLRRIHLLNSMGFPRENEFWFQIIEELLW